MFRGRLTAAIAGTMALVAPVGAQPTLTVMDCTNPASGTSWQIRIDYERHTVDGYAASIDESKIAWHDAKDNGNYALDRKTGKLTFVAPSSTGGYFLFDQCRPAAP